MSASNSTEGRPDKFLQAVAQYYTSPQRGRELYRTCLVCPNKRSRIFLRMYFKDVLRRRVAPGTEGPVTYVLPDIVTIGDLNEQICPEVAIADDITLLFILYNVYCEVYTERFAGLQDVFAGLRSAVDEAENEVTAKNEAYRAAVHGQREGTADESEVKAARAELSVARDSLRKLRMQLSSIPPSDPATFDNFAFWGKTLLNDFNDIDNGCADGADVLEKVAQWKNLSVNYLTEKERRIVNDLFPGNNIVREHPDVMFRNNDTFTAAMRQMRLYALLPEIYTRFTRRLDNEGAAYEGRLARLVALKAARACADGTEIPVLGNYSNIGFVGFGNLTAARMNLFSAVRDAMDGDGRHIEFFRDALDLERLGKPVGVNDGMARLAAAARSETDDAPLFSNPPGFILPVCDSPLHLDILSVPSKFLMAKSIGQVLKNWCTPESKNRTADPLAAQPGASSVDPANSLMMVRNRPDNTAIILPDASMLIPLLHAMPPSVVSHPHFENINVSLALPFRETPFATLLDDIVKLHLHISYRGGADSPGGGTVFMLYEDVEGIIANAQLRSLMAEGCRAVSEYLRDNRSFTVDIDQLSAYLGKRAETTPSVADIRCIFARTPRQPAHTRHNGRPTEEYLAYLDAVRGYVTTILSTMRKCLIDKGAVMPDGDDDNEEKSVSIEARILEAYENGIELVFEGIDRYDITGIGEYNILTLVYRTMATQPINVSSTPVKGLQVLGMLETRSLDFDNIIIPSMNEGVLPRRVRNHGFIPQGARYKYNESNPTADKERDGVKPLLRFVHLPTLRDSEREYAGYFFRLLNRATNVVCLYDSRASVSGGGTPSRYLQQLENSPRSWDMNLETQRLKATADKVREANRKLVAAIHDNLGPEARDKALAAENKAREGHRCAVKLEMAIKEGRDDNGRLKYPIQIARIGVLMKPKSPRPLVFSAEKDSDFVQKRLERFSVPRSADPSEAGNSANLSASALRDYIKCPFRFYLKDVLRIGEEDKSVDYMEASVFGTVVHNTLEFIFIHHVGRGNSLTLLGKLFEDDRWKLRPQVRNEILDILRDNIVINQYGVKRPDADSDEAHKRRWERARSRIRRQDELMAGALLEFVERTIMKDYADTAEGLRRYIDYLVRHNADQAEIDRYNEKLEAITGQDILFEAAEYSLAANVGTGNNQWELSDGRKVNVTFKIDRLDRIVDSAGNTLRLRFIDYKTGSDSKEMQSVESLFPKSVGDALEWTAPKEYDTHGTALQLLLYAMLFDDFLGESWGHPDIELHLYTLMKAFAVSDKNRFDDSHMRVVPARGETGDTRLIWMHNPEEAETARTPKLVGLEEKFREGTDTLIREILDNSGTFVQTNDINACAYCDFARLCEKNAVVQDIDS